MPWKIEFERPARKEFKKLGHTERIKIAEYLKSKVANSPQQYGKPLGGNLSGLWRYRIGNYRIVCRIEHQISTVVILRIAHRSRVYTAH